MKKDCYNRKLHIGKYNVLFYLNKMYMLLFAHLMLRLQFQIHHKFQQMALNAVEVLWFYSVL